MSAYGSPLVNRRGQRLAEGSWSGSATSGTVNSHSIVGDEKCHCGRNAIIYISKTLKNPQRPFLGCPYFQVSDVISSI